MSRHPVRLIAVAVIVAGAASAGIAIADVGSSSKGGTQPIAAAHADQVAGFSVLGVASSTRDVVDVPSRDALARDLNAAVGANLALARKIGDDTRRTWLVPGDGNLCTVADLAGRVVVNCVLTSVAAAGKAVATQSGSDTLPPGYAIVSVLLPDGASRASISTSDGRIRVDPVRNWLQATVQNPTAVEFDLAGDHHVVPLGELPS